MTIDVSAPIGVLGAGSWGTALAVHLARSGHPVRLWARSAEVAKEIASGSNQRYLPEVELPREIEATNRLEDCADLETVLMVVPSHGFRDVLREFLTVGRRDRPLVVVSGTKGIEGESLARMSSVCFEEGCAAHRDLRFAVLSGPTFAEELVAGTPTACVVASVDADLARHLRDLFSADNFRLYSSLDVAGVELAGTAKNVVAIAAGAAFGLGFGHNTLAALMTRGLHEITRLGIACGGRQRTFSGLAGLGDLVLTCTGGPSRNRQTGLELAAGKSLAQIRAESTMVAEGVRNSLALSQLAAQRSIEMPITAQMVEVLYHDKSPRAAVEELMRRDLKAETEM